MAIILLQGFSPSEYKHDMRFKGYSKLIISSLIPTFIFLSTGYAGASGFAIYTQSSASLGQGESRVAYADDPSAIFLNPALINRLEGTQISIGTTLIIPSQRFRSDYSRETYKAEREISYPSTLYISHKVNNRVSIGLGIFSPFGLGGDEGWGDDWEGRYITTSSKLRTLNINPVLSFQMLKGVSIALGIDFLSLDSISEKKINLSAFGLPDARQRFDGEGSGIGYNIGLAFDINKDITLGASYRSRIHVDIDGDITFDLPSPVLETTFPDTTGRTEITLPSQLHAAMAYKGINRLVITAGIRWEGWSSYDRLTLHLGQPVGGVITSTMEKDWKDVLAGFVGVRYSVNDIFSISTGYLSSTTPVPDDTFEPVVPDARQQLISAGVEIDYRSFSIDISYAYLWAEERQKDNAIDDNPEDGTLNQATSANGIYDSSTHLIGMGITYRF
jgi:long-chain fatty acid transport protein